MRCEGFSHSCDNNDAVRFRMHTAYVDEEKNYMNLCPDCQKDSNEYWQEQWNELNNDIMLGIQDSMKDRRQRDESKER